MVLGGQVIDETGNEAPGATVYVDGHALALSDARGWFAVLVDQGRHDVAVRRGDECAILPRRVYIGPDKNEAIDEPILISIARGWTIRGTVRDGHARPIAGATVVATSHVVNAEALTGAPSTVKSDAKGAYRIPGVCHADSVYASADGFTASDHDVDAVKDLDHLDFELGVAGTLRGRLVTHDGEPVAGAMIFFRSVFYMEETDAEGRFIVTGLAPGEHTFDVGTSRLGRSQFRVTVRANETREETFRLEPLETVSGRVVDERGAAVAGALVATREAFVESGPDGRFTLTGITKASVEVVATRETPRAVGRVEITQPQGIVIVLLPRTVVMRGRLQHADGSAASVQSLLVANAKDGDDAGRTAILDDGRFEVTELPEGECRVNLNPRPANSGDVVRRCDDQAVVITIPRYAQVTGVVTGGSKRSSIAVRLELPDEEGPVRVGLVDGTGHFTIEHILGGTYRICASDEYGDSEFQPLTIKDGETKSDVQLHLTDR